MSERYLIRAEIGRGQRAVILEAYDTLLGRRVALKRALDDSDPLLSREAKRLARVRSPHVIEIYDVLPGPPTTLVLEWLEGSSLRGLLDRERLDAARMHRLGSELLQALTDAHAVGVLHADLKPESIWMDPNGHLKLFDLGATPFANADTTPLYAAPEVLRGDAPAPASDLYAAASILFELYAGRTPFDGNDAHELGNRKASTPCPSVQAAGGEVPAELDAWLQRSLAPAPTERFESLGEAARAWAAIAPRPPRMRTGATVQVHAARRLQQCFAPGMVSAGSSLCIVGPRGFGKTHLLRQLLEAHTEAGTPVLACLEPSTTHQELGRLRRTGGAPGAAIPLLVIVDAFESLETESQRDLLELTQRAAALGVALVIAANPLRMLRETRERWCALVDACSEQIHLRRLDTEATGRLVKERLGATDDAGAGESLLRYVHDRSGGNPRYALGIVDVLLSSGALKPSGDTWCFDPELVPDILAALEALLSTAVADLDAETLAILREGAAFGHPFETRCIAERLGLDTNEVETRLHRLASTQDVISRSARGFEFTESLVALYLYEQIPASQRPALHRDYAKYLLEHEPHNDAPIGHHLFFAGERQAAAPALARGAKAAVRRHALAEARRLFDLACRALVDATDEREAAEQIRLHLAYARLLDQQSSLEMAAGHLETARALAQAWGLPALEVQATRALGRLETQRGHFDVAIQLCRVAQALASKNGDEREQQELALQIGNIHFERGELDGALAAYSSVLIYANEHDDLELEARASNNVALVESVSGRKERAVQMFARCLERFRQLGREDALARTYHNIGMTHLELHNPAEARTHFQECMTLSEKIPLQEMLAESSLAYAEASLLLNLQDTESSLQRALSLCRARDDTVGTAAAYRLLANLEAQRHNIGAATERLSQATTILRPLGQTPHLALALRDQGRILLEAGQTVRARQSLQEAKSIVRSIDAGDMDSEIEELLQECTNQLIQS